MKSVCKEDHRVIRCACGIRVAGASCMTNMAVGIQEQPPTHPEVLDTMNRVKPQFFQFLFALMSRL